MNPMVVLFVLFGFGIVWTVIWLWVLLSARQTESQSVVTAKASVLRRKLVLPMLGVLIAVLLVSMYWLPYPEVRSQTVGTPELTITAEGLQWAWIMSQTNVPVGVPVEFAVTSRDVNHDFSIYSPDGKLLTQTQAMPGYTNRLIYKFDKPGVYLVRCLEYCGLGHAGMIVRLTVA